MRELRDWTTSMMAELLRWRVAMAASSSSTLARSVWRAWRRVERASSCAACVVRQGIIYYIYIVVDGNDGCYCLCTRNVGMCETENK